MKRRTALGALAGLVAGAGCSGGLSPGSSPVSKSELAVFEPGSDFYSSVPAIKDPPRVTFEPARSRVVVVGRLPVGSSTCNEAALERVAYDEGTLRVTVGSGESRGNTCTGDESVDAYRATVVFDTSLPRTVVATETGGVEERETVARNPATEG